MSDYIWRCDLAKQYKHLKRAVDSSISRVLEKGVYTLGREVELFEKEFAQYINRSYGVGVASGTDALILSLKAAGIKKGDRVITSCYGPTPVPTAIVLAGGVPVFCDIEEDTCLVDPEKIEEKISRKTKFIIPVHLFGYVCNMTEINKIAKKNKLSVIEDAAQAHGSTFNGKRAGSFSVLSCFSFYPTKNLGGYGDGGMVLCDSKRTADRLRLLRNYGKKYNPHDSEIQGYNSRLDELQAAILRSKLRRLDGMNKKRAYLAGLYKEGLKNTPVAFPRAYDNVKPNYHVLTMLCKKGRDALVGFLELNSIQTNIYYPKPLASMCTFKPYVKKDEKFPVSERISKEALALPFYPELEERKVMFIIGKIKKYFLENI